MTSRPCISLHIKHFTSVMFLEKSSTALSLPSWTKRRTVRGYYSSFSQEELSKMLTDIDVLRKEKS